MVWRGLGVHLQFCTGCLVAFWLHARLVSDFLLNGFKILQHKNMMVRATVVALAVLLPHFSRASPFTKSKEVEIGDAFEAEMDDSGVLSATNPETTDDQPLSAAQGTTNDWLFTDQNNTATNTDASQRCFATGTQCRTSGGGRECGGNMFSCCGNKNGGCCDGNYQCFYKKTGTGQTDACLDYILCARRPKAGSCALGGFLCPTAHSAAATVV